jgi:hypothetical protein
VFAIAGRYCASISGRQDRETIIHELRTAIAEAVAELRADVAIGWLMPMARVIKGQYGAQSGSDRFSEYHLFFSKDLDELPELGHLILSSALSV